MSHETKVSLFPLLSKRRRRFSGHTSTVRNTMITSIAWVPVGVPTENPGRADVPDEELAAVFVQAGGVQGVSDRSVSGGREESGSGANERFEEDLRQVESSTTKVAQEFAEHPSSKEISSPHSLAVGDGLDEAMAALNMEKYDEEDDAGISAARLFGAGRATFYANNDDDPYVTIKDDEDVLEEDYPDDFTIRHSDLVILAARTDVDVSHLEVYVYEEAVLNGTEDCNLYCHHDLLLPAFPLSVSWMSYPDSGQRPNCVAVGTMYPGIEIWDLDTIDAVEPIVTLGGFKQRTTSIGFNSSEWHDQEGSYSDGSKGLDPALAPKKQKKRKQKQSKGLNNLELQKDSHADAVLSISWNSQHCNVLASASADNTVRIWDILTQSTQHTLTHHSNKVQAVEWNPTEPSVLLTGGFDKNVAVVDVRDSRNAAIKWSVGGDVECAIWNLRSPTQIIVSDETGTVTCFDSRMGECSNPIFDVLAHKKAATCMSVSTGAPSLLVTASTDKTMKLWDISTGELNLIAQNNPEIGALFTAAFSPSVPYLIGCAGAKGEIAVWDILSEKSVAEGCHGVLLERYNRAAMA